MWKPSIYYGFWKKFGTLFIEEKKLLRNWKKNKLLHVFFHNKYEMTTRNEFPERLLFSQIATATLEHFSWTNILRGLISTLHIKTLIAELLTFFMIYENGRKKHIRVVVVYGFQQGLDYAKKLAAFKVSVI